MTKEEKRLQQLVLEVMASVIDMNPFFEQGNLMFSAGLQDAGPGNVGTITSLMPVAVSPAPQQPLLPGTVRNPIFCSYPHTGGSVRGILFKTNSVGGVIPSNTTVRLLEVPSPASKEWTELSAGDITLQYGGVPVLTGPQGIAFWGNYVLGIDFDSQKITIIGKNELDGISGPCNLANQPHDLFTYLGPDRDKAKGQSIIALQDYLYTLYIVYNIAQEESKELPELVFSPSIIVRNGVSGGSGTTPPVLSNNAKATVGINAQEAVPIADSNEDTQLVIPAAGADQKLDATNGTNSNICVLPATGAWPNPLSPGPGGEPGPAPILVTGDPAPARGIQPTVYDFHSLAAICRDANSKVFILTTMYGDNYTKLYFRVYLSTAGDLLSLPGISRPNPSIPPTISEAVAAEKFTVIDEGVLEHPVQDNLDPAFGLYHPAIFVIQDPSDSERDLVVFVRGSEIMITRANAYGSPTGIPPLNANAYMILSNEGGASLNSIDITILSRYLAQMEQSTKQGGRLFRHHHAAAALRAAIVRSAGPAPAPAPAGEEGEEEK